MLKDLKTETILGNTPTQWLWAIGIFIISLVAIFIVRKVIEGRLKKLESKIHASFISAIIADFRCRVLPITYIIALFIAMEFVKVPDNAYNIIAKIVFVVVTAYILLFLGDLIKIIVLKRSEESGFPTGMITVFKILLWIFGGLFVAANLGYNVSTFITGLGIGGVAIALASQAILGDVFNYFVILFDKPFKKGDTIQIDSLMGTVEYIGIKTTRIRSVNGELLSVANSDLTKSRLSNYQMAEKRRKLAVIGVEYSTSAENLKQIPAILEECVKSTAKAEFTRVHFSDFGASSLDFELAYFVVTQDYLEYVRVVQEVNYKIVEKFNALGINFAFPSQTIYMSK